MIRQWVKSGTASLLCKAGITRVLRPRNLPVVIAYHRVVEDFARDAQTSNPSMLVSRRMLERHIDWIGRRYRFVDLDELGSRLEMDDDSNERLAAITFDDGYQDFCDQALPMLQRKGIPSAVFVVTDYVGTKRVHLHDKLYLLLKSRSADRLNIAGVEAPDLTAMSPYQATRALLESLPSDKLLAVIRALEADRPIDEESLTALHSLSWDTLERAHRCGVTIGSHTRSHVLMTNETAKRVDAEVSGSREEIVRRVPGCSVRHFAYPSGVFHSRSVESVARAGSGSATLPARTAVPSIRC